MPLGMSLFAFTAFSYMTNDLPNARASMPLGL
jgi:hypothetical protein